MIIVLFQSPAPLVEFGAVDFAAGKALIENVERRTAGMPPRCRPWTNPSDQQRDGPDHSSENQNPRQRSNDHSR